LTAMTKEQWRQDLQYFARELPKRHKNAFHNVTREDFERMVAELDARIPSLQDDQIAVGMLVSFRWRGEKNKNARSLSPPT
jgi:site-specific recombinase XerD